MPYVLSRNAFYDIPEEALALYELHGDAARTAGQALAEELPNITASAETEAYFICSDGRKCSYKYN